MVTRWYTCPTSIRSERQKSALPNVVAAAWISGVVRGLRMTSAPASRRNRSRIRVDR